MMSRILSLLILLLISAIIHVPAQQLPEPVTARPVHKDSVKPPVVTKLRGELKKYDAYPNVHRAVPQRTVKLPHNLKVVTIGEDGVPGPQIVKAEFKKTKVRYSTAIKLNEMAGSRDAQYYIRALTVNEGLDPTAINSMLEDSRGHLWLGNTSEAVYRLDGEHAQSYTKQEGFPLEGNVRDMIEDRSGRIWFAGVGGVCYFDGQHFGHFARATEPGQQDFQQDLAHEIFEDREGNIWFDYVDLYCFDGEQFKIYQKDPAFLNDVPASHNPFSNQQITDFAEDRHGNLWMSVRGNGVQCFDGKQVVHITEEHGLVDNTITAIKETSAGDIWFASGGLGVVAGKGLTRFVPKVDDQGFLSGTLINYNASGGLSDNRMTDIVEDKDGNVWFATFRGGIDIYDGNSFTHITRQEGLLDNSIMALYTGRDNVVWAGTNGMGLNQIMLNGFRHFTEALGYGSDGITAFHEDHSGNIWFGKAYGGLVKYDGQSFTHIGGENGLHTNRIHDVMTTQNGDLWIGTRDNGCVRFDGHNITHFSVEQGLSGPLVWKIFEDVEGMIWVSSARYGMNRIDPQTSVVTNFPDVGGGEIHQDKDGMIWFGGTEHVARYNPDGDRIEFMALIDSPEAPWVDHFVEDEAGNLWVGTAQKLIQLKHNRTLVANKWPEMHMGEHWPQFNITKIMPDHRNGCIWIASLNKGLFCLQGDLKRMSEGSGRWLNFTTKDGLKANSFYSHLLEIDSKNRLWINTVTNGMTYLDLDKFDFPEHAPGSLGLIDLEIGGKSIDYGSLLTDSSDHRLSAAFDSIATFANLPVTPRFSYWDNNLTFHYSTTDWTAPHAIRYSYMLEGFDEDWTPPNEETKAVYRNIPPGDYSFMVKAVGQAGIWSDPYSYAFSIRPPWWMTWWAYALYALLIAGSIGGYVMRLRRKIKLKQEQLDREQYLNRELRELNIATTRFVPKDFINILNKESLKELQLGDQIDATMTVLFADIRGYTELSEGMTPDENFKFINGYVGRMGPIIQEHGGFICQYYGDGMMALFKENHQQAIKAAVAMQHALDEYNKVRVVTNRKPFKIGIGLNTGHLMLGVIGDEQRYDTSVISDAVNTASRLEGLTKVFGSQIIVSEKTLKEIKDLDHPTGESDYLGSFRFLGRVKVKGKDQTLRVYEVLDGEPETVKEKKRKTAPEFEKAIQYYFDRKFGKAADILKEILELTPDDVAAQYYLDRSVQFIVDGVEEDWSGVEEMVSK